VGYTEASPPGHHLEQILIHLASLEAVEMDAGSSGVDLHRIDPLEARYRSRTARWNFLSAVSTSGHLACAADVVSPVRVSSALGWPRLIAPINTLAFLGAQYRQSFLRQLLKKYSPVRESTRQSLAFGHRVNGHVNASPV
jgi:hypothetical protein